MSFITPIFLFGTAAVLLPVLFHLVRKMKAKKVVFSSLMFLQATPKELVKRRRLRDVLLMLVRAAIFGLLALVFARPFIPEDQIPFLPQQDNQSIVLLIDRSYSMQYDDWFPQALDAARERIAAADADDEIALITFADDTQQLSALTTDRALLTTLLDNNITVSNRPTDFYKPIRLAEEILADARHEDQSIVLISDYQANGWSGAFENWKLAPGIRFEPLMVAEEEPSNAYMGGFNLTHKRNGDLMAVRYDARVQAEGDLITQQKNAALLVDGASISQQTLAGIAAQQLTFQQTDLRSGTYQGQIALGDDDLMRDNTYFFTYAVEDRPALLFIDEGARGSTRDAFFFENAFDLGEASLYQLSVGGRGRLTRSILRNQDVTFLANVSTLTNAQQDNLRQYVEAGGSLVVSFGDQVDAAAFSSFLQTLGVGRLTERVSARAEQGYEAIIGDVDLRHPVFNLFASGTSAIFRPAFRTYMRVVPDSGTVVVARYDTDDPFLLERPIGQGRIMVYTSTFNTDWTDFPLHGMYVPFLYQLVQYGIDTASQQAMYTVGDVVVLPGTPGETWDIRTPDGRLVKEVVDDLGTAFFRDTEIPGHYTAVQGRTPWAFSVNVDIRESALAFRDVEEAYATVVPPAENQATDPQQAGLSVEEEETQQKFWRVLLMLVVMLFAFETVYANRKRNT